MFQLSDLMPWLKLKWDISLWKLKKSSITSKGKGNRFNYKAAQLGMHLDFHFPLKHEGFYCYKLEKNVFGKTPCIAGHFQILASKNLCPIFLLLIAFCILSGTYCLVIVH